MEDSQNLHVAASLDQAVHLKNSAQFGYDSATLQNSFNVLNQRNNLLFEQLSTQDGIKRFFTKLGVWEPE